MLSLLLTLASPPQQLPPHALTPGAELLLEQRVDEQVGADEEADLLFASASLVVEISSVGLASFPAETSQQSTLVARAMNRSSGTLAWSQSDLLTELGEVPDDHFEIDSVASPDGSMFAVYGVHSGEWRLAAFDSATGQRLWIVNSASLSVLAGATGRLAFDPNNARLFLTGFAPVMPFGFDAAAIAFGAADGIPIWAQTAASLGLPKGNFSGGRATNDALFVSFLDQSPPPFDQLHAIRLNASTGAIEFDEPITGNGLAGVRLSSDESLIALGSPDVVGQAPFTVTTVATDFTILNASDGTEVQFERVDRGSYNFEFAPGDDYLVGIWQTEVFLGPDDIFLASATGWALDIAQGGLLWEVPLTAGFGNDQIADVGLGFDALGRVQIAVGRIFVDPIPVQTAGVQVNTLDLNSGAVLSSVAVDSGANEPNYPLVDFTADGDDIFVASRHRATLADNRGTRVTALDVQGVAQWSRDFALTNSGAQMVNIAEATDDRVFALEVLGDRITLRARDVSTGAELWSNDFDQPEAFYFGLTTYRGDVVLNADSSVVAALVQVEDAALGLGIEGILATYDVASGSPIWSITLPQIHTNGGTYQRNALTHDESNNVWLIAGGSGEDFATAIDSNGSMLWSIELPTPDAPFDSIFDGAVDVEAPVGSNTFVVASTFYDDTPNLDFDPQLTAFDSLSGAVLWATELETDGPGFTDQERVASMSADATVGQAVVAFRTGGNQSYSLSSRLASCDLATGDVLWTHDFVEAPGQLVEPRVVEHFLDGSIVVVAGSPRIDKTPYGINLTGFDALGGIAWETSIQTDDPFEVIDIEAVAGGSAIAVVASFPRNTFGIGFNYDDRGGRVAVVDAVDGQVLWSDGWDLPTEFEGDEGLLRLVDVSVAGEQLVVSGYGYLEGDTVSSDTYLATYSLPTLTADVESISLGNGGTAELELRAGPPRAGDAHLVLGSATGTAGIPLAPGVTLPLTSDAWLQFTLNNPNSSVMVNSFGVLDDNGRASSSVVTPPASNPSLAGLTVYYAYTAIDLTNFTFSIASNAVSHVLVP